MKKFMVFLLTTTLLVACGNKSNSSSFNSSQNIVENDISDEQKRNDEINDSISRITMPLSYKDFILGDSYSKCLKKAEKNKTIRKQWDNTHDRYEYVSELLEVDVFITIEEFQDTIYEITLNSSKWSEYRLDTLYKSKYGITGYDDVPASHNKFGWGKQRDTKWEFKNGIIEINHLYDKGSFMGAYVVYTDKKQKSKKESYLQKQRMIEDSIRNAKEEAEKEKQIKRNSEYKDEI